MDATIVGNPQHPPWREWIHESPDAHVIRVEALRDGKWIDFGTYSYRREHCAPMAAAGREARGPKGWMGRAGGWPPCL